MEDLKETSINDILLTIEKSKKIKQEYEHSIEVKVNELNNLKNELNMTKKSNLSFNVDNQNMGMIQNVSLYIYNFLTK